MSVFKPLGWTYSFFGIPLLASGFIFGEGVREIEAQILTSAVTGDSIAISIEGAREGIPKSNTHLLTN